MPSPMKPPATPRNQNDESPGRDTSRGQPRTPTASASNFSTPSKTPGKTPSKTPRKTPSKQG